MPYYLNIFTGLFDYYQKGGGVLPPTIDGVLLSESSEYLLTEAGDNLAFE